jgi:hypothetical protein
VKVRQLVAALVLALPIVTMNSAPAFAGWDPPTTGGSDDTGAGTDRPARQTTWHSCSIVSGPEYVGGVCAGSKSEGKSVKEILGDDPVPHCWHEPVSEEDLAAMGEHNVPGPDGYTYYWYHCLTGINPKTKVPEPGGIHISTELVTLPNGAPPLTLTHNQQVLVDGQAARGNVPTPIAVVSPADHPRVGLDVAFSNLSDGDFYVRPLGAVIHAYVDHTTIEPLGAEIPPKIGCPGNGTVAKPGQRRVAGDGLCWYRYLHSSAGQPDDVYDVRITSHWVVEIAATDSGPFQRLDDFTKSATTRIPVTEVQALVVQ